jgi:hypothetical protein
MAEDRPSHTPSQPREPAPPLPPVRYPENPSPWARFGRWLFDRLTRR